jgi:CHAT domain-containing protein
LEILTQNPKSKVIYQQHVVSHFSGMAADACSLILQSSGDAFEAIELLELSRGTIIGLLMDDRSDISTLQISYPEKAAAYDRLRNEVNTPSLEAEDSELRRLRTMRHLEAVKELDECIQSIRDLPEHQRFLLGPTQEELVSCASKGPIVVVNITDMRSDAIVVTASGVISVTLTGLTRTETVAWIQEDLSVLKQSDTPQDRGKKNKRYVEFLRWLWQKCVRSVLLAIYQDVTSRMDSLSRIWWIGVGAASSLPFHAAGDHSVGSTENTLSWAISSYTPTIKALVHARGRRSKTSQDRKAKPELLMVAMPTTPGESALPGVMKEISIIQDATNSVLSSELLVHPNARSVLERLGQCDLVHFTCHGMSDRLDPSNSCLLLQEGINAAPKADKLMVRQISEAHSMRAKIAFLSACSTAQNRVVGLEDEVIHLASGFQLAGFRHVVASMWAAGDQTCVDLAKGFYKRLQSHIGGRETDRETAMAIHDSVLEIRSKRLKMPLLWAPYIHLGA